MSIVLPNGGGNKHNECQVKIDLGHQIHSFQMDTVLLILFKHNTQEEV